MEYRMDKNVHSYHTVSYTHLDVYKRQVLYLDGAKAEGGSNSYLEFPQGFFDGHDSMTISMDVKEVTRVGNYFTFAIGQDDQKYLFLKTQPTYCLLYTSHTWK